MEMYGLFWGKLYLYLYLKYFISVVYCVGTLCGDIVWGHCVGTLCGDIVWGHCVGHCVGTLCTVGNSLIVWGAYVLLGTV